MIALPTGTQIWIAAGVTDLRRGFTGLSATIQTTLNENPFSGHVFVFRGRRGDLISRYREGAVRRHVPATHVDSEVPVQEHPQVVVARELEDRVHIGGVREPVRHLRREAEVVRR